MKKKVEQEDFSRWINNPICKVMIVDSIVVNENELLNHIPMPSYMGKLYFNEINTIPGSLAFYLWEPVGVPYKELLTRMINLSLKRVREEESLTFSFDTNILDGQTLCGGKSGKLMK